MKGLSRKKGRDVTGEDNGQETAIFCAECVKKFDHLSGTEKLIITMDL